MRGNRAVLCPSLNARAVPRSACNGMLRIHFLQHWFNLSDPAVEEALYDSRAMRRFVGIDLGREPASGRNHRYRKFRVSSGGAQPGRSVRVALIAEYLEDNGLTVNTGKIVRCLVDQSMRPVRPRTKIASVRPGDASGEEGQPMRSRLWHESPHRRR